MLFVNFAGAVDDYPARFLGTLSPFILDATQFPGFLFLFPLMLVAHQGLSFDGPPPPTGCMIAGSNHWPWCDLQPRFPRMLATHPVSINTPLLPLLHILCLFRQLPLLLFLRSGVPRKPGPRPPPPYSLATMITRVYCGVTLSPPLCNPRRPLSDPSPHYMAHLLPPSRVNGLLCATLPT